jgi:hypothetical protein
MAAEKAKRDGHCLGMADKHASTAMNTWCHNRELLETVFSIGCQGYIRRTNWSFQAVKNVKTHLEQCEVRDSHQLVTMWAEDEIVGISYQAMASENWEDLVSAIVKCRMRKLATAL